MKYRMLVLDLDDTLLTDDLSIGEGDRQAIQKASKLGVCITIATGRMFKATLPYAEQLGINVPVITYQGALIKETKTRKNLFHCPIPMDIAREVARDSADKRLYMQAYIDDDYYVEKYTEHSDMYERISGFKGIEVGRLDKFIDTDVTKLLIIDDPVNIQKLKDLYKKQFGEILCITTSKPTLLEFTHKDATKGRAIERLSKSLDIDRQGIVAIGDSYNDLPMIEYAGLGVAMGNASEDVKKRADYVTHTNNDNGIAHVIEKFILKEDTSCE